MTGKRNENHEIKTRVFGAKWSKSIKCMKSLGAQGITVKFSQNSVRPPSAKSSIGASALFEIQMNLLATLQGKNARKKVIQNFISHFLIIENAKIRGKAYLLSFYPKLSVSSMPRKSQHVKCFT